MIFSALSNSSFIQYCDSNIGLFSIASLKLSRAKTIAVAIVGRAKTIERAMEKEAINKDPKQGQ